MPVYLMGACLKGTVGLLYMLPTVIKGIVHPKMLFLSLFTHSYVVPEDFTGPKIRTRTRRDP